MSKRILMVCLGNICRSPLAHGILEHLAAAEGLDWHIDSAGTGSWHIGQGPDRRSVAVARQYGIDISRQRARQFNAADFDQFDYILVMDRQNLDDVLRLARNDEHRRKVRLFLNNDVVPDPYNDDTLFNPVYQLLENRCRILLNELKD